MLGSAARRPAVLARQFQNMSLNYDGARGALWCMMQANPRPCFTPALLKEARYVQDTIQHWCDQDNDGPLHYVVLASSVVGIFNLGGDLDSFEKWITRKDRPALRNYARACVDVCYYNAINYKKKNLTSVALVQGEALGGGFEAALSATILVAERQANFGLPEILFNLFPGMGAFSLLTRRIGVRRAEQIIRSGRIYSAEEMYDRGIVDLLAEDGEGVTAVNSLIESRKRTRKGHQAIDRAKLRASPLNRDELNDIVGLWVDAALDLEPRDLKMMRRLVKHQTRIPKPPALIRQKDSDRRSPNSIGAFLRNDETLSAAGKKPESH